MKVPGFASAASALRWWERRQEGASHSQASASPDGFRAERVFARMMEGALPEAGEQLGVLPVQPKSGDEPSS